MFEILRYFLRSIINRFKKQECPYYVTLSNNLPEGKTKYVNGSISLGHCRDHDCIIIDGFFEKHRRLFGNYNYWLED